MKSNLMKITFFFLFFFSVFCVHANSVSGTNATQQRSDREMERSSGRTLVVSVSPRSSGIDGEAIEFGVFFSKISSPLSLLQEIPKRLARKNIQPEEFKDGIIFISMALIGRHI